MVDAANSWFDEHFSFDKNRTEPILNYTFTSNGHFTQLIWALTAQIGCAAYYCDTLSGIGDNYTFVACEYTPAGNLIGAAIYEPANETASLCPYGTTPDEDLCADNSTVPARNASFTADEQTLVLSVLNENRRQLAIGNLTMTNGTAIPSAANMLEVTYNQTLAEALVSWAEACKLANPPSRDDASTLTLFTSAGANQNTVRSFIQGDFSHYVNFTGAAYNSSSGITNFATVRESVSVWNAFLLFSWLGLAADRSAALTRTAAE